VLGFLSVSTSALSHTKRRASSFQSRAGFSECLDRATSWFHAQNACFNPVLGFLSVSTDDDPLDAPEHIQFQSRAGFSECLD